MTRSRFITLFATVAVVPLAALAVAGCGGNSSDTSASTAPSTTTSGRPGTVDVANSDLGTILVNAQGRTLYLFQKDSGTTSECTGACASAWPPLRANGKPTVGGGATASLVGTTQRSDGAPQVTYNGHPLYLYSGDTQAGDTTGEGSTAFGGGWYAVSSAGDQVTGSAATPAPSGGY
jgi:predicted lipoprotein with Yx(FWY)xxD motif